MKKILTDYKFVFTCYGLFFVSVFVSILLVPKGEEVLWLNHNTNESLSLFFRQITHFGEWFFIAAIALYLLVKNRTNFRFFAIGFFTQLILSQTLKKIFNMPRPLSFFNENQLQLIEHTPKLYHHSFPSGHTTTAFFVAFWLILFYRTSKTISSILIILAILVGISRIYLLAHFKEDVLFGSFLGVLSALLPIYLLEEKNKI
jgi:membrane-associated phospholipid phosphatase